MDRSFRTGPFRSARSSARERSAVSDGSDEAGSARSRRTARRRPGPVALLLWGAAAAFGAGPSSAQLSAPEHWRWRTDEPARLVVDQEVGADAWRFVGMPPGWHLTTGPAALLWDPAIEGRGRFVVETRMILFPEPSEAGYGVFVGGRDLDGEVPRYTAFLIRRDGSAAVVTRGREATDTLVRWTRHEAIRPHGGSGTVENVLGVAADAATVIFTVNGDTVASLPRERVDPSGRLGFRIGESLNMHITTLDVTYRLAPAREGGG